MMRLATLLLLLLLVLGSALMVVKSRQDSRRLFAQLQSAQRTADRIEEQWGRLQLEQATWATHARIVELAHERLGMRVPAPADIVLVTP